MKDKQDGDEAKPFYQDIVSQRKRHQRPPKTHTEGNAEGERARAPAPEVERAGSERRFGTVRPENRGGRSSGPARSDFSRSGPGDSRPRGARPGNRSDGASRPSTDARRPQGDRPYSGDRPYLGADRPREGQGSRSPRDNSAVRSPRDSHDSRDNRGPRTSSDSRDFRGERGARPASGGSSDEIRSRAPRKPFAGPNELTPVFGSLPAATRSLLESFPDIVQSVMPLDSKKQLQLSADIRDLSHELTDERGDRRVGYMNEPAILSAYIRYYMWWNLVRLTRLFVNLPIELADGDAAVDLGSGPLTLPIALWMARPDLRKKKLTWYCVDISQGALSTGEELFLSLAAKTGDEPWQIVRVKGECGVSLRRRVTLVASANMFNELFWDNPLPLEEQTKHHAQEIASYAAPESSVLVIEPGVPRAGRFVSLMRDSLMELGFAPVAPCPHAGRCPFPGLRNGKWCHFVFDTADAPAKLHKLSEEAGLSKDRAALSFIFAGRKKASADEAADTPTNVSVVGENGNASVPKAAVAANGSVPSDAGTGQTSLSMLSRMSGLFPDLRVRITSDPIRLPEFYTGRYGCSEIGMVMVTGTYQAADYLKDCNSGSLIEVPMPERKNPERDQKTNAIIVKLK